MRLSLVHARAMTVELLRYPAYLVPTLLLPTVFFLFFVAPGPRLPATARMATFAGFAVIGVAFFQFGVGIAIDRASPWEAYLRTLPVGPPSRLAARLVSASIFACAAAGLLVVTAVFTSSASLSGVRWACLAVALAAGYWAPPKAALPLANLLYLALAYAGGLWTRPSALPHGIAGVSRYLPTRAYADALVAAALGLGVAWRSWLVLAAFTALFGLAAVVGYRRDEGRRFT